MTGGTESGTTDNCLSKFHQNDTIFVSVYNTGGERTRVSAGTLVKMAEDSFIASVNYRQIYRHGTFIGNP